MAKKSIIQDKVEKKDKKRFTVKRDKPTEVDADIEVIDVGDYQVDKLNVDDLPTTMPDGKTSIRWLNYFSIKKGDGYIKQPYNVTISGLGKSQVVILDTSNSGKPYYFPGQVVNDTIQLTDGDPGIGQT